MAVPCDWQTSTKTIKERGKYLLETGQWADCRFIVGIEPNQQIFDAHKLFLAMSSPVFEAMFFGGMAEKDPISILDVQPDAFKALLEYIYTDKNDLSSSSFDQACELCYVAKKYMLPDLVKKCTKHIWEDVNPQNVCRAYEFAKLFEEQELIDKCMTLLVKQTNEVLAESSFCDAELETILTIFDQDELDIVNELDLYTALTKYASRQTTQCPGAKVPKLDGIASVSTSENNSPMHPTLRNAIMKIRFLTMSPQQFAEGPASSNLLSQSEKFAILMNILSTSTDIPMPEGFSTLTHERRKPQKFHQQQNFLFGKNRISTYGTLTGGYNGGNGSGNGGNNYHHAITNNSSNGVGGGNNFQLSSYNNDIEIDDGGGGLAAVASSSSSSAILNNDNNNMEPNGRNVDRSMVRSRYMIMNPLCSRSSPPQNQAPRFSCRRVLLEQTNIFNQSVLDCSVMFTVDKNICIHGIQIPSQISGEIGINNSNSGGSAGGVGGNNSTTTSSSSTSGGTAGCNTNNSGGNCTTAAAAAIANYYHFHNNNNNNNHNNNHHHHHHQHQHQHLGNSTTANGNKQNNTYSELLYAHLLDADGSRLTYTHYTSRVGYSQTIDISFNRPVYIQRNKLYKVGVVLNKTGHYPIGTFESRASSNSVIFTFGPFVEPIRDLIQAIIFTAS